MSILTTQSEPNELSLRALEIARTQIGITEHPKGSNKGPEVDKYLLSAGINFPASWCAAFIYWCYEQASKELGVKNPLIRTGGVLKHYNETTGIKVAIPKKGDIFIMDFGKGLGHTGLVDSVNLESKTFTTVEGNAEAKNIANRTGGTVCKNTRNINSVKGFIRY